MQLCALLMSAIISKVNNAINTENSLLITQTSPHHTHSLDKQSFNYHSALLRHTIQQSANLRIKWLDLEWILWDTVCFHSAVHWTVESFPLGTQPEWMQCETTHWAVQFSSTRSCLNNKHTETTPLDHTIMSQLHFVFLSILVHLCI